MICRYVGIYREVYVCILCLFHMAAYEMQCLIFCFYNSIFSFQRMEKIGYWSGPLILISVYTFQMK